MRNDLRLCVVMFALVIAAGCGSADQPAPSSSTGTDAPAAGTSGVPASTPGPDTRGEAPAAAPNKEAIITTMPMDVPSGTELILTLETPVSSETAKPDQPVRSKMAKPVIVAGMEVIPKDALVTGAVVSAERSGKVKGRASLALRFNEVTVMNTAYRISTAPIAREAEATKGEDAMRGEDVTVPAGATLRTTITETVRIIMPM